MSKSPVAKLGDRLEDRIEDAARDVRRAADNIVEEAQENLAAAARSLADAADALAEEAADRARTAGQAAMREVREHPIATTAIVLSAFALAAVLFSRRR